MGAAVSVGERKTGIAHLLAGRLCGKRVSSSDSSDDGQCIRMGVYVRRAGAAVSEAILRFQLAFEAVVVWRCSRAVWRLFHVGSRSVV